MCTIAYIETTFQFLMEKICDNFKEILSHWLKLSPRYRFLTDGFGPKFFGPRPIWAGPAQPKQVGSWAGPGPNPSLIVMDIPIYIYQQRYFSSHTCCPKTVASKLHVKCPDSHFISSCFYIHLSIQYLQLLQQRTIFRKTSILQIVEKLDLAKCRCFKINQVSSIESFSSFSIFSHSSNRKSITTFVCFMILQPKDSYVIIALKHVFKEILF